jgi:hypothetical protein
MDDAAAVGCFFTNNTLFVFGCTAPEERNGSRSGCCLDRTTSDRVGTFFLAFIATLLTRWPAGLLYDGQPNGDVFLQ